MNGLVPGAVKGEIAFPTEQDVEHFANKFACQIPRPLVIWLEGDLGAGKTTFARGLIHALGYAGRVKSPTYGLLEHYQLDSLQVLHMDLYRISDPGELEFLGIEDLLDDQTVLLIEWPDKGGSWLPEADFIFRFSYAGEGRELHWVACTPRVESFALTLPDT
ncbi:MAG: tRNA (adenosine(37)-N6)-threonylcarbamoyltransferase complex ATPase subunit type 1 TsaE [Xanthomonadales bacterium]|nr:tRNA (adenosine(37)-N6)-threonylcarbamoyltransferase complex ATPase subunit type 1 TsaE [Xanthomonadales bacterium]